MPVAFCRRSWKVSRASFSLDFAGEVNFVEDLLGGILMSLLMSLFITDPCCVEVWRVIDGALISIERVVSCVFCVRVAIFDLVSRKIWAMFLSISALCSSTSCNSSVIAFSTISSSWENVSCGPSGIGKLS